MSAQHYSFDFPEDRNHKLFEQYCTENSILCNQSHPDDVSQTHTVIYNCCIRPDQLIILEIVREQVISDQYDINELHPWPAPLKTSTNHDFLYIHSGYTDHPGFDTIYLTNGEIIGITDEAICVYDSKHDLADGNPSTYYNRRQD